MTGGAPAGRDAQADRGGGVRRRVLLAAKVLWVGLVVVFGGWYLVTHWSELVAYARNVGLLAAVASLLVLTGGRILLAAISRCALQVVGTEMPLSRSFYINTLSQLGKYVPGSVWHLVGRIALYRQHGVSAKRGSAVLAIENGVLVASGALIGAGLAIGPLLALVGMRLPHEALVILTLAGGIAMWWVVISQIGARLVRRFGGGARLPRARLLVLSLAFWAAFGLAFWLLLTGEDRSLAMLPVAAGGFAIAWVAGYLSPFAPAGIGVREAVLIALLGPVVGVPVAAATAAGSRIIWTIQEFALAPLAAAKLTGARKTVAAGSGAARQQPGTRGAVDGRDAARH